MIPKFVRVTEIVARKVFRAVGVRNLTGSSEPLTSIARMAFCTAISSFSSGKAPGNSIGPIAPRRASSPAIAASRVEPPFGHLKYVFPSSRMHSTSSAASEDLFTECVSFWLVQRGMTGTGGCLNASRYRNATPDGVGGKRRASGLIFRYIGGCMTRVLRALARLDDHWIGDLIGVLCLFGCFYGLLFIGFAMGLK